MPGPALPFVTDRAKFVLNTGTALERMLNMTDIAFTMNNNARFASVMTDNRQSYIVQGNLENTLSTGDYILQDGTGYINLLNVDYNDIPCSIIIQSASSSYVGNGATIPYNGPSWVFTGIILSTQDIGYNVNNPAQRRAVFLATGVTEYIAPSV